jgi:hypothetical protein
MIVITGVLMTSSKRRSSQEHINAHFLHDPTQPGNLTSQLERWEEEYKEGSIVLPGTFRMTEREAKRLSVKARRSVAALEEYWVKIDEDWTQYLATRQMAMKGVLDRAEGVARPRLTGGVVWGLGRNAMALCSVGVYDLLGGCRETSFTEPALTLRSSPEGLEKAADFLNGSPDEKRLFNIVDGTIDLASLNTTQH